MIHVLVLGFLQMIPIFFRTGHRPQIRRKQMIVHVLGLAVAIGTSQFIFEIQPVDFKI